MNFIFKLLIASITIVISTAAFSQSTALSCNEPTPWISNVTAGLTFDASNCGGFLQPPCSGNVLDSDLNNYHSISTLLSSGYATVEDPTNTYNATATAPFFVGFNFTESTLLNLDLLGLLNNVTIATYNNGVLIQSESGSNLSAIGVGLLSQSRITGGFIATQPFDEIRITFGLGLLSSYRVYYPVIQKFCAAPLVDGTEFLECNTPTLQNVPDYPLYINTQALGVSGVLDVDAGVTNPDSVIDNDTSNFAQMYSVAGVASTVTLPVANAVDEYPANTFAGFVIEKPGILGVNVLDQLTVATYSNGTLIESASGASGLADVSTGLLYGTTGKQTVGFVSTQAFDEVRISFTPLVGVLNTINVYSMVTTRTCALTLQCEEIIILTNPETPAFVNFQETGVGTACVGCQIENADFVTNIDTSDAAEMVLTAGLLGSLSLSVQDPANTYPGGSLTGFVVESGTLGLLVLDLLENITVTTFLDGTQQESQSASNLLDLELLGLLGNQQTTKRAVGFYTSLDFDEVKISFGGLVNAQLLSTLNIYYAFVETSLANGGGGLNCCPTLSLAPGESATQNVFIGETISPLTIGSTLKLDKALKWVLFTSQQTGSAMYSGGTVIDSSTADEVTSLASITPNRKYFSPEGTYYIYLIPTGLPADITCRPYVEFIINVMSTKPDVSIGLLGSTINGNVNTNDFVEAGSTYSNVVAQSGNPSGDLPVLNSDGTYSFLTSTSGTYYFTTTICDATLPTPVCKDESLKIVVQDKPIANRPPVALDDVLLLDGDEATPATGTVSILLNDASSGNGGSLSTPSILTGAANGTAVINGSGQLEYTPNAGFYGMDTVIYQVCETPSGLCDDAQVIITVANPNSEYAIQASDDLSYSKKGEQVTVAVADGLLINDFTTGTGPMAITPQNQVIPGVGSLIVGPNGAYIFTPDANFTGSYAQPYEVCDNGTCTFATLHLLVEENIILWDIKCFLEGPFTSSAGTMTTHLSTGGSSSILATNALNQPYNASPWNYAGTESVTADFFDTYPSVTDWILVQLRDKNDPSIVLYQKACFLTSTGEALDVSGNAGVAITAPEDNYYVSVVHRNHANVASLNTVVGSPGTAVWDIRTDDSNVYTTGGNPRGVKRVLNGGNNYYVLHGGDCNNDQNINATDVDAIAEQFFLSGYLSGDTYLDGVVNATDASLINLNFFFTINFP